MITIWVGGNTSSLMRYQAGTILLRAREITPWRAAAIGATAPENRRRKVEVRGGKGGFPNATHGSEVPGAGAEGSVSASRLYRCCLKTCQMISLDLCVLHPCGAVLRGRGNPTGGGNTDVDTVAPASVGCQSAESSYVVVGYFLEKGGTGLF